MLDSEKLHIAPVIPPIKDKHIEIEFQVRDKKFPVFFRSEDIRLVSSPEASITCILLPSMKAGGRVLSTKGEISQKYLFSLAKIQDILISWDSSLQRVHFPELAPVEKKASNNDRVGSFFTGGVDSFYTFLKNKEEITDLIFVHGYDVNLKDISLRERISESLNKVAAHFNKNLIEIETNLRTLLNPFVSWPLLAHGAALAAVGHLLSEDFKRIYIAATHTFDNVFPWGSNPVLDPLWSSEKLQFIHDGCEADRIEKIKFISEYDFALENLRVCYENRGGAYNCCECYKCLRTMISLEVIGILKQAKTFHKPLMIKDVSRIIIPDRNHVELFVQSINELEKKGNNPELLKVLYKVLNRPQWLIKMRKILGIK